MKKLIIISVTLVTFCLFFAGKNRPVHIFMAGDSTMALKLLYKNVWDSIAGDSVSEVFPERGWGQLLPEFFNQNIVIEDYAQNGRSSRTFIEQGWWQKILDNVQARDYVVIQFGHNDSAEDRPDRYTPPKQYVENLTRFVDEVKAKGATPIVCTSVVRRRFDSKGVFQDSHGEYVELARQVAQDKNVLLIDMYEKSKELLIDLGKDQSASLFLHIEAGENKIFPQGKTDNTHFKETGARIMASLFVEGLKENNVKPLIKEIK